MKKVNHHKFVSLLRFFNLVHVGTYNMGEGSLVNGLLRYERYSRQDEVCSHENNVYNQIGLNVFTKKGFLLEINEV